MALAKIGIARFGWDGLADVRQRNLLFSSDPGMRVSVPAYPSLRIMTPTGTNASPCVNGQDAGGGPKAPLDAQKDGASKILMFQRG